MALVTPVAMLLNYRLNHMRGKLKTGGAVCGPATAWCRMGGGDGRSGSGGGGGGPFKLQGRPAMKR